MGDGAVPDLENRDDVERDRLAAQRINVDSLDDDGVTGRHNGADFAAVDHSRREAVVLLQLRACGIASGDHGRERHMELPDEVLGHQPDRRVDVDGLPVEGMDEVEHELLGVVPGGNTWWHVFFPLLFTGRVEGSQPAACVEAGGDSTPK